MSFPRYDRYKDSGVAWLGEVPAHWRMVKIKHLTSRIGSGKTPLGGNETYVDEGVMFLRSQNVYDEGLYLDDVVYISAAVDELMAASRVLACDILLNITGASIGRSCVVPSELPAANVNQHVCIIRLADPSYVAFVGWCFKSAPIKGQIDFAQNGAAREGLNFEQIAGLVAACPPAEEQQAIAAFLDRETATIDALITEQRRLIDLLREKRQAVISHAVTKGLDPEAPMRDSGVAWLGEVPAHWAVCPIKRMSLLITDGAHASPETADGVYDFVSTADIDGDLIDFDRCLKTSPSSYEYLVRTGCQPLQGDVLFSKDGTIGRTVVVRMQRAFVVASSLIIIRPDSAVLKSTYLNYLCQSSVVRQQVDRLVKGAGLPRLSIQNLLKVVGVFPPIKEQQTIVTFLNRETARIDALMAEAETAIALLQERRTALISAAVTGKIDVRGRAAWEVAS